MAAPLFAQVPLEKVSVQMSWKFQFEYAGFIAAKEKGFYRDAGLDVELREYREGVDTVANVLSRKATYGLYNTSIVIDAGRLKPIVLLGTYCQHSPLIFVARKGISKPSQMVGKTIMGTKDEFKYSTLGLMLGHFGVTEKNARFVDHTFHVDDFVNGKVDVMSVFRSNELYYLDKAGIEYETIDPADYGFVMSAVNLFTSPAEALKHTERTRRFIQATNRGWHYALAHSDEIVDILLRKYATNKSREALLYEAKVTKDLMLTDFYKVGEVNPELTVRAFKQLSQAGLLRSDQKLGRFMFNDIMAASDKGLELSPEEKEYLLNKKKILMCVDPEWYPLEAIREGRHIGMAAEVMDHFEKKLGTPIELVRTASWEQSLQYVKSRRCDILSLSGETPQRLAYLDFTEPYLTFPLVLVTTVEKPFSENLNDLKGKKIGVVKGYATLGRLREQYKEVSIVEVASITEGLEMVERGELFGYIDNLAVATSYVQKEYAGTLKVSSRLYEKDELRVATRSDQPILHSIFEKSVRNLDEGTMQGIYNRWMSTVEEVPWIDRDVIYKTFGFIILGSLMFGWRYYNLRRLNTKLREMSITDKLTGLYNRQKTDQRLIEEKTVLSRYPEYRTSVMLIDIDYFKTINDTYGHQAGDTVLCELAGIFRKNVRSIDIVGRWGGEEFIVILPHTGLEQAVSVAENLRSAVAEHPFETYGTVTISIGVGEMDRTLSVHENIAHVDCALYKAKREGRNLVRLVDAEICQKTMPC